MLIDTLDIAHSGRSAKHVVTGPSQDRFIEQWATLLESVGWTKVEDEYATASVTYPLGAPVTGGVDVIPKTVVGCNTPPGILTIGTREFSLYDPYTQVPGTTSACTFVPMGLTPADTLDNLASAVGSGGVWLCSITYNGGTNYTLTITALAGGPLLNELQVDGNIISGSTITSGGGYKLASANDSSSAQYYCTLTCADRGGAGDDYLNGLLKFDFSIGGHTVTYQLIDSTQGVKGFMGALGVGGVASYTIIANPYGFTVFDIPHDTTAHVFRTISLFCMAPYFPSATEVPTSEVFVPAFAVFVLGPNAVGGSPAWRNGPSTMSLDAAPFQNFSSNPMARVITLRSPIYAITTVYDVPLFLCPYVQFGSHDQNTDPAWVVGKLWDCALVTDYVAVGANLDGKDFGALGHSDGSGNKSMVTLLMDEGTTGVYAPLGQSARCASAAGTPGSGAYENTGH
jgi:hypothetical protein